MKQDAVCWVEPERNPTEECAYVPNLRFVLVETSDFFHGHAHPVRVGWRGVGGYVIQFVLLRVVGENLVHVSGKNKGVIDVVSNDKRPLTGGFLVQVSAVAVVPDVIGAAEEFLKNNRD